MYLKKLWEWFAKNINRKLLNKNIKREAFMKEYIRFRNPDLTEKEISNLYKYTKKFVGYAIKIVKSQQEATKDIRNELKGLQN